MPTWFRATLQCTRLDEVAHITVTASVTALGITALGALSRIVLAVQRPDYAHAGMLRERHT